MRKAGRRGEVGPKNRRGLHSGSWQLQARRLVCRYALHNCTARNAYGHGQQGSLLPATVQEGASGVLKENRDHPLSGK